MARITVEDCIDKFPSRFELVLVSSQRARKLHSGEEPTVERDNDKNTVVALREIAETTITVEEMKENLIQEYQTVTLSDEEDENLHIESLESDTDDKIKESSKTSEMSDDVEEELKELVSSEDNEINEQYEINDTNENHKLDNDVSDNETTDTKDSSEEDDKEVNAE